MCTTQKEYGTVSSSQYRKLVRSYLVDVCTILGSIPLIYVTCRLDLSWLAFCPFVFVAVTSAVLWQFWVKPDKIWRSDICTIMIAWTFVTGCALLARLAIACTFVLWHGFIDSLPTLLIYSGIVYLAYRVYCTMRRPHLSNRR